MIVNIRISCINNSMNIPSLFHALRNCSPQDNMTKRTTNDRTLPVKYVQSTNFKFHPNPQPSVISQAHNLSDPLSRKSNPLEFIEV